jgi:hypothetical protein
MQHFAFAFVVDNSVRGVEFNSSGASNHLKIDFFDFEKWNGKDIFKSSRPQLSTLFQAR